MPIVTSTKMFKDAMEGNYAVGAFNVNNMELIQAIVEAADRLVSPLILQVSEGAREYAKMTYLLKLVEAAAIESKIPICLHLDHGRTFELCRDCIDAGFPSVMIDGSDRPFEENIALTKRVVKYAHLHGAVVEGELGVLAGVEDNVSSDTISYTDPRQVEEFVDRTGVDSLAVSIGTSHGAHKYRPGQTPILRFDILDEIARKLPGFPIVLHGASSILAEHVAKINRYGGNVADAIGVPEALLREAVKHSVCKVNVDTDFKMLFTAILREFFFENPEEFDLRKYLGSAREGVTKLVEHKMIHVLGCAGKAAYKLTA